MQMGDGRSRGASARERGRLAREWSTALRERCRTTWERSRNVVECSARLLAGQEPRGGVAPAADPGPPRDGRMPASGMERLIASLEEERRRVSLELHDSVGQRIAAASIALGRLTELLSGPATAQVRGVMDVLADVTSEVRRISHGMHPAVLELVGLAPALRAHCAELRRLAGLDVEVSAGPLPSIPREVGLCLYRVTQEALGNVVAHSGVRRAGLCVTMRGHDVELEVSDTGRGFDSARVRAGLGLAGMHERVRLLHGTFRLETHPGEGTRIHVRLPVDAAAPSRASA